MQLVFIENNRPVTDSLTIAEQFAKRHDRVMQDIRELGCSDQFRLHHFVETPYVHPQNGQTYQKYIMTEQGFTMLAMGYTGKKAMNFKEQYINEFDRMRLQIEKQPQNIEVLDERKQRIVMMKAMIDHNERLDFVEDRIQAIESKVDEQITMDSGEQRKVQRLIAHRIYGITADKTERSTLFRQLYREIKDRWAVPSYRDVRRNEVDGLINYIEAWKPISA